LGIAGVFGAGGYVVAGAGVCATFGTFGDLGALGALGALACLATFWAGFEAALTAFAPLLGTLLAAFAVWIFFGADALRWGAALAGFATGLVFFTTFLAGLAAAGFFATTFALLDTLFPVFFAIKILLI
jgi:hypothetical protein